MNEDINNNSIRDVHFNDNEEELTYRMNDIFDEISMGVVDEVIIDANHKMKFGRKKMRIKTNFPQITIYIKKNTLRKLFHDPIILMVILIGSSH